MAEGIIQREITNRNARVGLLQDLVDRMRRVIEERGAEMADVPGGSSGLLVKTYKGKDSDTAGTARLGSGESGAKAKVRPIPGNAPHDRPVSRVIS